MDDARENHLEFNIKLWYCDAENSFRAHKSIKGGFFLIERKTSRGAIYLTEVCL